MGVDLRYKHIKKGGRKNPVSENVYLRLLVRLYKFLERRTGSAFNRIVLKRLCMSNVNRPAFSLRKLVASMKNRDGKIAVVVSSITDDHRVLDLPKLNVCALRFSATARARIQKAGGKCYTFDELALLRPTGTNCVLLRGPKNREVIKHFGAKGVKHGHAKPYVGDAKFKGKKFGIRIRFGNVC